MLSKAKLTGCRTLLLYLLSCQSRPVHLSSLSSGSRSLVQHIHSAESDKWANYPCMRRSAEEGDSTHRQSRTARNVKAALHRSLHSQARAAGVSQWHWHCSEIKETNRRQSSSPVIGPDSPLASLIYKVLCNMCNHFISAGILELFTGGVSVCSRIVSQVFTWNVLLSWNTKTTL